LANIVVSASARELTGFVWSSRGKCRSQRPERSRTDYALQKTGQTASQLHIEGRCLHILVGAKCRREEAGGKAGAAAGSTSLNVGGIILLPSM
jgi:hypothetical protein